MKFKLKDITIFIILLFIISGCGTENKEVNETESESIEISSVDSSISEIENSKIEYKPMVMIDDIIYVSTGKDSDIIGRCGMMDGKITSEVSSNEKPKINNQSNFGIGYDYQYVNDGIDLYMPDGNEKSRFIRFEPLIVYTDYEIGINAHVKEVHDNYLIISSDTDDFPGAFIIMRPTETEVVDVKEGDYISILMSDMAEKEGLPKYLEKNIIVLDEKEGLGKQDVILNDAPLFVLTDPLSSQLNSFEIKSKNYSWNFKENGEIKNKDIQEEIPPNEIEIDSLSKLKLPVYNKMETAIYSFSTIISPDILTVYEWDIDDNNNIDTKGQKVITYYYKNPILNLKPKKLYKFKADWKEDNIDINGFYGTANYILLTE